MRDVGAAQHGARAARGARGTPKTPPRDTQKTPEGHAGHSWDSKRTQSTTVTPSGHPTTSRAPGGHLRHSGTVYGTPVGHSVDTKVIQGTPRGAQNSQMIPMPPSPVAAPSLPSPAGVGSPGPGAWGREHARGEPPKPSPGQSPNVPRGRPHLWRRMSMPCCSSSSRCARFQSGGGPGDAPRSRSRRACSGCVKRNTWFFPKMRRWPGWGGVTGGFRGDLGRVTGSFGGI